MHKKIPKHQEAYNVTRNTLLSFIPMTGTRRLTTWTMHFLLENSMGFNMAKEFEMWTHDYVTIILKMGYLKEDS